MDTEQRKHVNRFNGGKQTSIHFHIDFTFTRNGKGLYTQLYQKKKKKDFIHKCDGGKVKISTKDNYST